MGEMDNVVLLRRCGEYDAEEIKTILWEGCRYFSFLPQGKVLVKPNAVYAHPRYARHTCTNTVLLRSLLELLSVKNDITSITVGERTGVGVPTRYSFTQAGYDSLQKIQKVHFSFFDEEKKVTVPLKNGKVHKEVHLAKSFHEADCKIYVPKLKHHVTTKMTCVMKLNIGILDSRDRLNHHHYDLEEKIVDLLEVGWPDFIAVDAVDIGEQCELVSKPKRLGAIIMGRNPFLIDAVCAYIMGFKPEDIGYLRIAEERGYGSLDINNIKMMGNVSPDELRRKVMNLDTTFGSLPAIETNLKFYAGENPQTGKVCEGGCMNMLKCALAVAEANKPASLKNCAPVSIVMGNVDEVRENGIVFLLGDCAKVNKIPEKTKVISIKGCPVSVVKFMLPFCHYSKVRSPYLDAESIMPFAKSAARASLNKLKNMVV